MSHLEWNVCWCCLLGFVEEKRCMRGWSCVRCGGIEAAEEEEEDDHREKSILFVCLFVCFYFWEIFTFWRWR